MSQYAITGYSNKLDGFLFVCEASSTEDALRRLVDGWDGFIHRKMMVPEFDGSDRRESADLLLKDEYKDKTDEEICKTLEDGVPRWDGFRLYVSEVNEHGFAPFAVCW